MAGELRVIATAGHVDHGKSSLIVRLTGMDPDRLAEEKRRGLTIDLGYAWCRLPSGREIGFVDVPGHERFVRNMLAGVGPVRLVMFVVAADEGWKPQSEEHLQILDVLGVSGGVIAVTKKDLVDEETLAVAEGEVAARLAGTVLEGAPILAVSSRTGEGVDELAIALDEMVEAAPPPTEARTRLFVDRVFTIKGAGTVVTGTLAGGRLRVGDEAELYPTGVRARIRALQTHKTQEEVASPVSRVAANLVGVEREGVERGCVMGEPDLWRPSTRFDADVRPVRGLDAIPAKGAYKVYAGASEADATIRLAEGPDGSAYVRVTAREPLVLDVGDRFVLREAGRRATVGGGTVLQVAPPRGFAQPRHLELLARRRHALEQGPTPQAREALARLTVEEGGAVRIRDLKRLVGGPPDDELVAGTWGVDPGVRDRVASTVTAMLEQYHREHPLGEGAGLADVRDAAASVLGEAGAPPDPGLIEAILDRMPGVTRSAAVVRMQTHEVELREGDLKDLLAAVERTATPPTVAELLSSGIVKDLIEAASAQGAVVRVSKDIVLSRAFVDEALDLIRAHPEGITISALREALGTSRKYAVPLAEWMDAQRLTRREGDLRFPLGTTPE